MNTDLASRVLDLAVDIQQIPAPTFAEGERVKFIFDRFQAEGLAEVSTDRAGNVLAKLPGKGRAAPLVVSAHLDTVFPAGTDLRVTRKPETIAGPGIGDNSLGVAGLFGLLWTLLRPRRAKTSLPGDIWLVANVGEEGLGDLCGMKAVVERFGDQPRAYLVVEGMALGQVYHRGLGVQRYRISAVTPGGHSWVDYGAPSAIHELAALITRLTALPLPAQPRTSLNVGVVAGGTSINTIAARASLELDLRSEGSFALEALIHQVEMLVQEASRPKVAMTAEVIGQRPAGEIPEDHPLLRLAMEVLRELKIEPRLNIGSTDANIPLSQGLPSICIGLTTGSGAHTLLEQIQKAPVANGLRQLVTLCERSFSLP